MATIFDCLCPSSNDGNHKWKDDRCRLCGHRRCPTCGQGLWASDKHACAPTLPTSETSE